MAKGMLLVCRTLCHAEAQQGDDGGSGVGEVVDAVTGDCNGAAGKADDQLEAGEKDVADNANDARQLADSGVDIRGMQGCIGNEQAQ